MAALSRVRSRFLAARKPVVVKWALCLRRRSEIFTRDANLRKNPRIMTSGAPALFAVFLEAPEPSVGRPFGGGAGGHIAIFADEFANAILYASLYWALFITAGGKRARAREKGQQGGGERESSEIESLRCDLPFSDGRDRRFGRHRGPQWRDSGQFALRHLRNAISSGRHSSFATAALRLLGSPPRCRLTFRSRRSEV